MDDPAPPVVKHFVLTTFIATSLSCIAQQCVVDWNEVYQRIDGFGASSAFQTLTWTAAEANMFFSTNTGIGLSLLRMQVQPEGFTHANEIALAQMAQARGAKIWSTPWTPPASFKNNGSTNGGSFVSSYNQAYANELAGYVAHLTNSNIQLYALSIQNEPDAVVSYVSCYWSPQQFHDFVPYLSSALAASNAGSTKIMLPESESWYGTSFETTAMNDPATAAQVGILANHNYDGINFDTGATSVPDAQDTYGKSLWETEVSTGDTFDGSITNAIYWAGRIHLFMTVAQANAWHYWWLIPWGGTDNQGLTDASGNPAKRMYALGHFSRFVRPNFYRVDATVTDSAALISAYKSEESTNFVIVAINPTADAISQTFSLTNFSAATVTPWLTTAAVSLDKLGNVPVTGAAFTYEIPAMSVMTFVGQAVVSDVTLAVLANPANGGTVTGGGTYSVGAQAQIAASPDAGWVFTAWSDGVNQNPRDFTVPAGGATLAAGFKFKGLNAQYVGLFSDSNGLAPQSSGAFKAKFTAAGSYNASLAFQGKLYTFAGRVSAGGTTSNHVVRAGETPLAIQLTLDSVTGDALTGEISAGAWTSEIVAERAPYSGTDHAPQAAKYTLIIPGGTNSADSPGGDGCGAVTVGAAGGIAVSGSLGDGTAFSQNATISGQGNWPFYVSLYSGGGEIIGWLAFSNAPTTDLSGPVTWIKPSQRTSKLYPEGFVSQTQVVGSQYGFTNKHPILNFTNGEVLLAGGDLADEITNAAVVTANGKITGTNRLSLTVNTASGLFLGTLENPATKKTITVSGAVLEKQSIGAGHFAGTNQSGEIFVGAGP
jgi:glucuronoarabinoxylan endo-1,4-beta-xylanase